MSELTEKMRHANNAIRAERRRRGAAILPGKSKPERPNETPDPDCPDLPDKRKPEME